MSLFKNKKNNYAKVNSEDEIKKLKEKIGELENEKPETEEEDKKEEKKEKIKKSKEIIEEKEEKEEKEDSEDNEELEENKKETKVPNVQVVSDSQLLNYKLDQIILSLQETKEELLKSKKEIK